MEPRLTELGAAGKTLSTWSVSGGFLREHQMSLVRSTRTGLKRTTPLGRNKERVRLLGTTVGLVLAPRESCPILHFGTE